MKNCRFNKHRLSKGIEVYINSTPQFLTTSMEIAFFTPLTEEAGKTYVLSNVLEKGSKSYPTLREVNSKLADLKGASLHSGVGKYGHLQEMYFFLNALTNPVYSGEESPFDSSLTILEDMLTNPYLEDGLFSGKYVKQAKEEVEKGIIERVNQKKDYAFQRLYQTLYPNSPYSLSVDGELDLLKQINEENLYSHYKKLISESDIKILISGSKSEDEYLKQMEHHFAKLPRGEINEELMLKPDNKINPSCKFKHEKMEGVNESQLIVVYQHGIESKDQINELALVLYNSLLGGSSSARMFQVIREKNSLAYGTYSYLDNNLNLINCWAGIENHKNYEKTVGIIKEQIGQLSKGNFTKQEIDESKAYLINMSKQSLDSPNKRIGNILGLILADKFDRQDYSYKTLRSIKKKDIKRVAETINPEDNFIYFLRPK